MEWLSRRGVFIATGPEIGCVARRLPKKVRAVDTAAGKLTAEWARKTGLTTAFRGRGRIRRAHRRHWRRRQARHAGQDHRHEHVRHQRAAEYGGTGRCSRRCGIVDGSVLPGYFGLEAGQSAVGDIFNWWVNYIQPGATTTVSASSKQAGAVPGAQPSMKIWRWRRRNFNPVKAVAGARLEQRQPHHSG